MNTATAQSYIWMNPETGDGYCGRANRFVGGKRIAKPGSQVPLETVESLGLTAVPKSKGSDELVVPDLTDYDAIYEQAFEDGAEVTFPVPMVETDVEIPAHQAELRAGQSDHPDLTYDRKTDRFTFGGVEYKRNQVVYAAPGVPVMVDVPASTVKAMRPEGNNTTPVASRPLTSKKERPKL